jgi:hypothetical protein
VRSQSGVPLDKRPSTFIKDKFNLSSERMLLKDYDRKKKSLVMNLKEIGTKTNCLVVNHQS